MAGQHAWQQVVGNVAESYERDLVPAMFAPWAPLLVAAADVRTGERILDVACGTGVVARAAAECVGETGSVVGLDVNAAMLAVAGAVPPGRGAAIDWCEASALAMPLPDASFDAVLCQHGLQQFTDRPAALGQMRRVLKPGGRLAVLVWAGIEESPGMAALVAALERHVGSAAANNRRAPFALADADELERLLMDARFQDVSIQTVTLLARFPAAGALVKHQLAATPLSTLGALTTGAVAAVVADVQAAMQPHLTDAGLAVPMAAHIAVARL